MVGANVPERRTPDEVANAGQIVVRNEEKLSLYHSKVHSDYQ